MVEEMYREFKKEKYGDAKPKDKEGQSSQSGKEDESNKKNPISSLLTPSETLKPLLKLNVKFELPMYNGEVDVEKIDKWVRQMEVYCSVKQITEDEVKNKLESLRLTGTTLIWWQSKL